MNTPRAAVSYILDTFPMVKRLRWSQRPGCNVL